MDLSSILPASIRALPMAESEILAYRLAASGCEVLFAVGKAGQEQPWHHHDTDNATVIVSGETVILSAEGERRYGPGEWYLTRPGQRHAVRFPADTVQIELRFAVPRKSGQPDG